MPKRVISPLDVRPIDPFTRPDGPEKIMDPEFPTDGEVEQDAVIAAGGRAIQTMLLPGGSFEVIYHQGNHHLLLVPKGDKDPRSQDARVYDVERNSLSGPMSRASVIAQGYWEPTK